MKERVMGALEKFSKAMVQPLMYLSAAGILIVVGVLLTKWRRDFSVGKVYLICFAACGAMLNMLAGRLRNR